MVLRRLAIAGSVLCTIWAVFWLAEIVHGAPPASFRGPMTTAYFGLLAVAFALNARGRTVPAAGYWMFPVISFSFFLEARSRNHLVTVALMAFVSSVALVLLATVLERRIRKGGDGFDRRPR